MYGVLFLLKLKYWAYKFNENRTSLQVYSCEFSKKFQNFSNCFQSLTIFAKRPILDDWQGSEYASETATL